MEEKEEEEEEAGGGKARKKAAKPRGFPSLGAEEDAAVALPVRRLGKKYGPMLRRVRGEGLVDYWYSGLRALLSLCGVGVGVSEGVGMTEDWMTRAVGRVMLPAARARNRGACPPAPLLRDVCACAWGAHGHVLGLRRAWRREGMEGKTFASFTNLLASRRGVKAPHTAKATDTPPRARPHPTTQEEREKKTSLARVGLLWLVCFYIAGDHHSSSGPGPRAAAVPTTHACVGVGSTCTPLSCLVGPLHIHSSIRTRDVHTRTHS